MTSHTLHTHLWAAVKEAYFFFREEFLLTTSLSVLHHICYSYLDVVFCQVITVLYHYHHHYHHTGKD